ncbi:unnamed protein product [Penicillium bialowiezense]
MGSTYDDRDLLANPYIPPGHRLTPVAWAERYLVGPNIHQTPHSPTNLTKRNPRSETPFTTTQMEPGETQVQGVAWVQKTFCLEPKWTVEPDLGAIEQTIKSLHPSSKSVQVAFLAQGALNKLYDVTIDNDETFIIRVSLPVDPYYKTTSEVARLEWISRTTSIPVPRVITCQPSRESPIGFEWIAMTKMPGKPLKERWRSLPFSAKKGLVQDFAVHFACLFQNQLQGIGNICHTQSSLGDPILAKTALSTSAVISTARDPLAGDSMLAKSTSSKHDTTYPGDSPLSGAEDSHDQNRDWIISRLSLSEKEWQSKLDCLPASELDSDDEADLDDATRTLKIIRQLQGLLPSVFRPSGDEPEPSVIFHDDLSGQNILVDESGGLTAVLDWECVSALPLWIACDYPAFLHGPLRDLKPNPEEYQPKNGEPEDGERCDLYWEHLWQYETTLLHDVLIKKMEILEPAWVDVYNKSQPERDFELAIQLCENEFLAPNIVAWIDDLTAGVNSPRSLSDRMRED